MVVYKFYLRDAKNGDIFLGALPERRRNPRRVTEESTEESIINWGRKYFGENGKEKDIYFIKTVSEESEEQKLTIPPP
jgi:hypothetical protein